jgi:hypothetical protein
LTIVIESRFEECEISRKRSIHGRFALLHFPHFLVKFNGLLVFFTSSKSDSLCFDGFIESLEMITVVGAIELQRFMDIVAIEVDNCG